MRKKNGVAVSTMLIAISLSNIVWATNIGPGIGLGDSDSYTYIVPSEKGPGVTPIAISDDFLHLEVENPIVKVVDKYSYEQMAADIASLQQTYGDKMQVNVIGTSLDGRNIYDIIIGNPSAPKQVLIQGGIHAREYMTPLLMMSQVEFALVNYDTGHYNHRALSDMFGQVAVHFIPMSNPDGVTLSQFGLERIQSEELRQIIQQCYAADLEAQRTTASFEEYLTKWKANARGVDLNQNFPASWEQVNTSAVALSYAGYKGTAPLSEPESQALAAMADRYPWSATISYHSQGEIIYWDSSTNTKKEESRAFSEALSEMTGYALNGSYGTGGYKDWMQSKSGAVPGATLEVGKVPCPLPVSEYPSVWQQNKGVWVRAMDYVIRNR